MRWRKFNSLGLSAFGSLLLVGAALVSLSVISGRVAPTKAHPQLNLPSPPLVQQKRDHLLNGPMQDRASQPVVLFPNRSRNQVSPTVIVWDDADSHHWIGEPWGDDIAVDWLEFDGRRALQAVATSVSTGWGLMRTDAFPAENWENKTALRADIYLDGNQSGLDVKLDVRNSVFDPPIESIRCYNLQPKTWVTCTWNFSPGLDYSAVAHLSLVFEQLYGSPPTFYVDNLRLVSNATEEMWDDMDSDSRQWFYFGNWLDWSPGHTFGLEAISHNGNNPTSPAGSIYLAWDYAGGAITETTAEVGTSHLDDVLDWRQYNRISADIKVSDPAVPISLFFWDAEGDTSPTDYRGFGTGVKRVAAADTWQTITWDVPWPSWFDPAGIDEIKVVANDIDQTPTGTLYIDNISLHSNPPLESITGLDYSIENFNDGDFFNNVGGNWGAFSPVTGTQYVTLTVVSNPDITPNGNALKVSYNLPHDSFGGMWQSVWGDANNPAFSLDFSKGISQVNFSVRGSGLSSGTHNIKVELKDTSGVFSNTAYHYITIDDADTTWQEIALDADVSNETFWSYNVNPPDPQTMKQLVLT